MSGGDTATMSYEMESKHVPPNCHEWQRGRYTRTESWEEHDGVWYLRHTEDVLLEVLPSREFESVLP